MPPPALLSADAPLPPPPPLRPLDAPPVSLLLRPLFAAPGTGGAKPGGFPKPGMAGGTAIGRAAPAEAPELFSIMGAERSLVTAFLSLAPFVMSVNKEDCEMFGPGGGKPC